MIFQYIPYFILLITYLNGDPLLFPHGYFDSKNLRPRDAIMLNMMAQSNLEYEGETLENLNLLGAIRKVVPRPSNLERNREEDDKATDQEPIFEADGNNETTVAKSETKKPVPFHSVKLQLKRKRQVKEEEEEEEESDETNIKSNENPFEEIATRAPPPGYYRGRKSRRHRKKKRKHHHHHKKSEFLTRKDIIHAEKKPRKPAVQFADRTREENEFKYKKDEIQQRQWFREVEETKNIASQKQTSQEKFENPVERLIRNENHQSAEKESGEATVDDNKIPRLPNNPYKQINIRKPTILTLPIPPEE